MTETSSLIDIDLDDLQALSDKATNDPSTGHRKVKVVTNCESGFNNISTIRDVPNVKVSEPHALLGDNSAANPTEVVLAALGSCINVGIVAVAGHRGVTLTKAEVNMVGDIDISAVWGVGDLDEDKRLGVSKIQCDITVAGDADEDALKDIVATAVTWSPVVNTMTNPAELTHSTTVES